MKRELFGAVAVLVGTFSIADRTLAQVVPDNTVGTTVNLNGTTFEVNNGMRSGNNLFHSFSQFSVPTGGSAIFNNPLDIQNIFSRVTGSQLSNIDGILKTQGTANLFLMNPNGIIFGPNAQLQLGGSFLGTTANSIQFADGIEFNSLNTTPALLSVNVPIGLQMGTNSGTIQVQNTGHRITSDFFTPANRSQNPPGLQVNNGQALSLIGGSIHFTGGILSTIEGGHLEVGSVGAGEVKLKSTTRGLIGDYSAITQFKDIDLGQQSLLDASGSQNSITLQGQNINITEGSGILLQHFGFQQPSQGITINATGNLSLTGNTLDGQLNSFIQVDNLGSTPTGDINLSVNQLLIKDGSNIHNWSFTPIPGGHINAKVTELIQIDGFAPQNPILSSSITTIGLNTGPVGDINILTKDLKVLNGGSVSILNAGSGKGGTLTVHATNWVEITGNNQLTTLSSGIGTSSISTGNAGSAIINTAKLLVRDSGILGSSALASGAAANVTVNASEFVEVSGQASNSILPARIASTAEILDPITQSSLRLPAIPSADAGTLTINTPVLRISDRANVTVKADGPGSAGFVQINATSIILENQARITAASASGEGGNIRLDGQNLVLRYGSTISAMASGSGNGGNLTIDSPMIIGLENSDITANAMNGRGGNISITTQGIFGLQFRNYLTPNNDISASSEFGVNGNVKVNMVGINPTNTLNALPANIVDSSREIADRCGVARTSSFIVTGRGGIPKNPSQKSQPDRPWHDLRGLNASKISPIQPIVSQQPVQPLLEASTLQITESGVISLVAGGSIQPHTAATCGLTPTP